MNIESLKFFYMIAKEGSISNVAKSCHISQSALSQQIQRLENDIQKKLLVRSNKGVMLTDTGKIVYQFAANILRTHDEMMRALDEAERGNLVVKIEACSSVADYALPCTLIKANVAYPQHHYELSSNFSAEILANVSNNICDVGFICDHEVIFHPEMEIARVGTNSVLLVSKSDGVFPGEVTAEKLMEMPLIMFPERNNITKALLKNLQKLGYDQSSLNRNLRVESIESAKVLIEKRYGIAFLPYVAIKEELYKKQFKVIATPEFNMDLEIAMLHKKDCAEHVRDFVAWFKRYGSDSFC
ncbi:MAG: LysR family transcriptional regulator [Clostridiaceae bacterium]|nr:LysR family transcriptional regulator [Eubacteriales bacterium]